MPTVEELINQADSASLRIEMVGGIGTWELMPGTRHQRTVDRIRTGIRRADHTDGHCGCVHYADILVRFPDGSMKRPDISIFCREPDEEDEAVTLIPEAVIEVLSKGYEAKDLVLGAKFYPEQGVKDVVILDPISLEVIHIANGAEARMKSPVQLMFQCGCICDV
jgi:Uma2 family endonuclease